MSYSTYIFYLVSYVFLVGLSFVIPSKSSKSLIIEKIGRYSKPQRIAVAVLSIGLICAGISGFIGMFLLWQPAKFIFFGAVGVRIIQDYGFGDELKMVGARAILAHLTVLFEFFLAWLVFAGSASALFHS